eukprot:GHVN01011003.1.p1 GENE.GHVN01011003.1~~GHVN01011003.1.p1  ORF type:complete len:294 (-),score=80.40 GHVN01011003.1:291-1172(-)
MVVLAQTHFNSLHVCGTRILSFRGITILYIFKFCLWVFVFFCCTGTQPPSIAMAMGLTSGEYSCLKLSPHSAETAQRHSVRQRESQGSKEELHTHSPHLVMVGQLGGSGFSRRRCGQRDKRAIKTTSTSRWLRQAHKEKEDELKVLRKPCKSQHGCRQSPGGSGIFEAKSVTPPHSVSLFISSRLRQGGNEWRYLTHLTDLSQPPWNTEFFKYPRSWDSTTPVFSLSGPRLSRASPLLFSIGESSICSPGVEGGGDQGERGGGGGGGDRDDIEKVRRVRWRKRVMQVMNPIFQ